MDWTEIGNVAIPALVGALSAILSAFLTNVFAERRHKQELQSKDYELRQRLLEFLVPERIRSYETIFSLLNRLKRNPGEIGKILEEMEPHLLWIESSLTAEIVDCLKARSSDKQSFSYKLSSIQEKLKSIAGVTSLDQYFSKTTIVLKEEKFNG